MAIKHWHSNKQKKKFIKERQGKLHNAQIKNHGSHNELKKVACHMANERNTQK